MPNTTVTGAADVPIDDRGAAFAPRLHDHANTETSARQIDDDRRDSLNNLERVQKVLVAAVPRVGHLAAALRVKVAVQAHARPPCPWRLG